MGIYKNNEFKKVFIPMIIFSIIVSIIALIRNFYFGLFVLFICAVLLILFLINSKLRYKKISKLSNDINKILHGDESINLQQYSEGEISILQSEIYKMTVKLSEQQKQLQDDKVFLSDSIADISHQLRTPLTSANLLVSLMSEPNLSDEKRIELSSQLLSTLSRMDWLIVTLLKLSKLDAGTVELKRENLTLESLIQKSTEHLLIPMEIKEQTLKINASGNFYGDMHWSIEAISNILKNCMEHTPQGGTIEITAQENPINSEIIITDSGCGFSQKDLTHLFDRFYKGENSDKQSFGIGLALAKTIINNQKGTIKAKNAKQGGAQFIIKFYK